MRIQFDVKYRPQIESGEYKVKTKGGESVHILSFEALGPYPICYQVGNGMDIDFPPRPDVYFAHNNGECSYPPNSLFIITPEEELTDFENAFGRAMMEVPEPEEKEEWYQFLKEKAAELLSLAREQLKPDINFMLEDNYKTAYKEGYDEGRVDALKDLPRWKKVGLNTGQTTLVIGYTNDEDKLYRNGYVISLTDLEKLPKEDKK